MQKTDFIQAVAERAGVSHKAAKQVVEAALAVISEALQRSEKVTLTGFGTFDLRQRQARTGINPQTRQPLQIPASSVPGFRASAPLRAAVRGTNGPTT